MYYLLRTLNRLLESRRSALTKARTCHWQSMDSIPSLRNHMVPSIRNHNDMTTCMLVYQKLAPLVIGSWASHRAPYWAGRGGGDAGRPRNWPAVWCNWAHNNRQWCESLVAVVLLMLSLLQLVKLEAGPSRDCPTGRLDGCGGSIGGTGRGELPKVAPTMAARWPIKGPGAHPP